MICPNCRTIMNEVYYISSIYFFCTECGEEKEFAMSKEAIELMGLLFTNDNYDEPMGEW